MKEIKMIVNTVKMSALSCLIAVGAACSDTGAGYSPIMDGTRNASYDSDLMACQGLARQKRVVDGETGNAVLMGSALGAALGAADDDGDAVGGAVAGALGGVLANTAGTPEDRKEIVIACMQQRGHRVVG